MNKHQDWSARVVALGLSLALGLLLAGTDALAQSQPSAKATVQVSSLTLVDSTTSLGWTTLLSNSLKTANSKDLVIGASMECGVYTQTLVKSKTGTSDTSSAEAIVEVQVLVDGKPALPGVVTFCRRSQQLTAIFQGLIDGCLTVDALGNVVLDETCVQPESLELIQDTLSANHFNFVLNDLPTGVHRVEVQARIDTKVAAQTGTATAKALIGKGSMYVEEIRMIKNEDIVLQD